MRSTVALAALGAMVAIPCPRWRGPNPRPTPRRPTNPPPTTATAGVPTSCRPARTATPPSRRSSPTGSWAPIPSTAPTNSAPTPTWPRAIRR
ncbi:hypothetical protein NKH77_12075 [Streptomyces sp. M19]